MRRSRAKKDFTKLSLGLCSIFVLLLSSGCAKYKSLDLENLNSELSQGDAITEIPLVPEEPLFPEEPIEPHPPVVIEPPGPAVIPAFKYEPLAWENSSKPERAKWSAYAHQIIEEEYDLLNQVEDATTFCPKFNSLNKGQRINFWGQLVVGMSYYESGWSPVSRMWEKSMGIDEVTGKKVYSEGLLQLSYQDIKWATYCEFDWNKDKYLPEASPQKTILDPYKNLRCGIKILANQIRRKKEILLTSGVYWAVLIEDSSRGKAAGIKKYVQKLSFCK